LLALLSFTLFKSSTAQAIVCAKSYRNKPTSDSPRVVVISGTNRTGSLTLQVSKQLQLVYQNKGSEVSLLDIGEVPLSTYAGKNYFNTPKSFQRKFDRALENADAIVVVFPEYNGSFPGMLGTFLNFVSASFQGKPISLVGISAGQLGGQKGAEHLSSTLRHRKADIIGEAQVNIPLVENALKDGRIVNENILNRLTNSADALLSRVERNQAFRKQLNASLDLALNAPSKTHVSLNSGITVHGKLAEVFRDQEGNPFFLKWSGATELQSSSQQTLSGQGADRHPHGFSSPIGKVKTATTPASLSEAKSLSDLQSKFGLHIGVQSPLVFESEIQLSAKLVAAEFNSQGQLQLLTFENATMTYKDKTLYQPDWGAFDMLVGEHLKSVGP
jgi:NAD(P)H-dependent FMN reductase